MRRPEAEGGAQHAVPLAHPLQAADDHRLGRALHIVVLLMLVVSLAGGLVSGEAGAGIATVAIALVIATPLARVCWLVVRWLREGDVRFAAVGLGLLAIVAAGFVLSLLRH